MKLATLIVLSSGDTTIQDPRTWNVSVDSNMENAKTAFFQAVRDNIGSRRFDGEFRDLTEEEIQKEISDAVEREYDWTGWDTSVQLFFHDLETE